MNKNMFDNFNNFNNNNKLENNIFLEDEKNFNEAYNIIANNNNDFDKDVHNHENNVQDLINSLTVENDEMNFLFQKLDKNLKHPFFNFLNFFKIEYFESLDNDKVLNPEHSVAFSTFLNEQQTLLYRRFIDCFESYYEKNNLKQRLNINSKLIMLKIIFDSIKITPDEFLNKLKTYEIDINKEFSTQAIIKNLIKEKIMNLKVYKEKLKLELENLQKQI